MTGSLGRRFNAPESRTFITFLVTGGAAAATNLGSRFLLSLVLVYEAAVPLAYFIGMIVAFLLFRRFVFEGGTHWMAEFRRFAVVNAFAFVLVWAISVGLGRAVFPAVGFTWHALDIAHFVGVLCPAVTSYLGHKHYTFGAKQPAGEL